MSKHKELWDVCKELSSDFEPYGKRSRDEDYTADCSVGCKFFNPLEGEAGFDWGVCSNRKSPRAGMLTFEHQGCKEFVYDDAILKNSWPHKERGDECTDDCKVHDANCDGFCAHIEHRNQCLVKPEPVKQILFGEVDWDSKTPEPEKENNMAVWVVEAGEYDEHEVVGVYKTFESMSEYLLRFQPDWMSEPLVNPSSLEDAGDEKCFYFKKSGSWIRAILHEVK